MPEKRKGILDIIKLAGTAILACFFAVFFVVFSPIFLITITQLTIRTVWGLTRGNPSRASLPRSFLRKIPLTGILIYVGLIALAAMTYVVILQIGKAKQLVPL